MSFQFPVVSSKSSSEWVGYISGCDWWISHCSLSHRKMLWMHHPAWWLGFSSDKLLVINIIPIIIYHHHHLSSEPRAFHEYWQPLAFPQAMCHGDAEVNSNRPSMQHPWGSGSPGRQQTWVSIDQSHNVVRAFKCTMIDYDFQVGETENSSSRETRGQCPQRIETGKKSTCLGTFRDRSLSVTFITLCSVFCYDLGPFWAY